MLTYFKPVNAIPGPSRCHSRFFAPNLEHPHSLNDSTDIQTFKSWQRQKDAQGGEGYECHTSPLTWYDRCMISSIFHAQCTTLERKSPPHDAQNWFQWTSWKTLEENPHIHCISHLYMLNPSPSKADFMSLICNGVFQISPQMFKETNVLLRSTACFSFLNPTL